jgi:hypothetical protein
MKSFHVETFWDPGDSIIFTFYLLLKNKNFLIIHCRLCSLYQRKLPRTRLRHSKKHALPTKTHYCTFLCRACRTLLNGFFLIIKDDIDLPAGQIILIKHIGKTIRQNRLFFCSKELSLLFDTERRANCRSFPGLFLGCYWHNVCGYY